MNVYFHGCDNPTLVLDAMLGSGTLRHGFHLAVDEHVAANYGSKVIRVELEGPLEGAHVGRINKDGNHNKQVGNGIEVVLKTQAAINSFYHQISDATIQH